MIFGLSRKKIIILVAVLLALIGIGWMIASKKPKAEYTTAKVVSGNLLQTVSESGTLKPAKEIDLNFVNPGKVARLAIAVGDKVKKDQVLAELDYSGLAINLREAEANLNKLLTGATNNDIRVTEASVNQAKTAYDSALREQTNTAKSVAENISQAQENLSDLEDGATVDTTYEQAVKVAENNLNNTKSTYQRSIDNSRTNALITIGDKLTTAKIALDNINRVLTDEDAKDVLSAKDTSYLSNTRTARDQALILTDIANVSLTTAQTNKTDDNINKTTDDALSALNKTLSGLNYCYGALEKTVSTSAFTQTELDSFKTTISGQITAVNTAISSVQSSEQTLSTALLSYETNVSTAEKNLAQAKTNLESAITSARNTYSTAKLNGDQQNILAQSKVDNALKAWDLAKAQLSKLLSPARSEDVILAQSQLDGAKNKIINSQIKAPIDGVITKINYEIGEDVSATKPVISMLGENNYEIEVQISEADIAKIKINDPVDITLDAFGDNIIFGGNVYSVDPAETLIQDVVYYRVKVAFIRDSVYEIYAQPAASSTVPAAVGGGIKPGMTANVVITTARKDNVLTAPARAVLDRDGQKYVRVLKDNEMEEKNVTVGLRGDGGMVEIISGLKEGEDVITFVKEIK